MKKRYLVMPIFKPLKKFKAPKVHVARIKKQIATNLFVPWSTRAKLDAHQELQVHKNRPGGTWTYDRGYHESYNPFFRQGLGEFFNKSAPLSIHQALKLIAKETRRGTTNNPLRILEDGAGQGVAISELETELTRLGLKTKNSTLTLKSNPKLEALKKSGVISEINLGRAEFYVPQKPVDVIISVAGSISHLLPRLQKEHLLKFAYSLRRGGILLASFSPQILSSKRDYSKRENEKFMQGIVKSFQKRGFQAQIIPNHQNVADMPTHMLIVRRISA